MTAIVEGRRTCPRRAEITEINPVFTLLTPLFCEALLEVTTNNAQGEKYITDVLSIARSKGHRTSALAIEDRWED